MHLHYIQKSCQASWDSTHHFFTINRSSVMSIVIWCWNYVSLILVRVHASWSQHLYLKFCFTRRIAVTPKNSWGISSVRNVCFWVRKYQTHSLTQTQVRISNMLRFPSGFYSVIRGMYIIWYTARKSKIVSCSLAFWDKHFNQYRNTRNSSNFVYNS